MRKTGATKPNRRSTDDGHSAHETFEGKRRDVGEKVAAREAADVGQLRGRETIPNVRA